MPPPTPAEFEPAIPASERPQTDALDRATTGIGTAYITKAHIQFASLNVA
jgi:hypothetical protein